MCVFNFQDYFNYETWMEEKQGYKFAVVQWLRGKSFDEKLQTTSILKPQNQC